MSWRQTEMQRHEPSYLCGIEAEKMDKTHSKVAVSATEKSWQGLHACHALLHRDFRQLNELAVVVDGNIKDCHALLKFDNI